ncbi:sigma-54-dependent Fis family transcriptional regulator [Neptunomonas concharum]|uniref:Sigma-54-dependent Fis family transcriptional regulator n=1 Tax=Neptunomonas concharum TaxID=1031538 RepID=A0A5P1R9L6_9GAMM|nr:sigma-54-dependent Fis family transcriptional regulator [Neptunomonas concharum]QEQ96293.1 sigma-54-dependent Fis family transcriptional regulator [Neptunomonas concharum]
MSYKLEQRVFSDPLQDAQRARERLLLEGEVPSGFLRAQIEASWQRSLKAGVRFQDPLITSQPPMADLFELKENHQTLLSMAAPEMDHLSKQFNRDKGMVILANEKATILSVLGDKRSLNNAGSYALDPGICWSEETHGTNALGTAVVDGKPVMINGTEHFLDGVTCFSCTSTPIKGVNGQLLGVLDLTTEANTQHIQGNMSAVQLAARSIENRLFISHFQEQAIIAFHSRTEYLRSAWQGLIAIDMEGKILALNEQACQLLKKSREQLQHQPIEAITGQSPTVLLNQLLRNNGVTLQLRNIVLHCELLHFPRQLTGFTSRREPLSRGTEKAKRSSDHPTIQKIGAEHPRLAKALRMALKGINHDLPVLLNGETGTGKEVVARALHNQSRRCDKPFVAVNCAAIPEGLIESELFGYREGAFTGSRKGGMVGRFQQANNGTLFLDEIGDMPLALQARLLRVLQERKVAPLGGGEEVDLDIALICATHRDIKTLVKDNAFREDLYYRLNGVGVQLPALRVRSDLEALLSDLLTRVGASGVRIHEEVLDMFRQYSWPGNIRQLEMVLKAAVAFLDEGEKEITIDHLTDDFIDELSANSHSGRAGTIKVTELELIRNTLDQCEGNVSATAAALGISRATIYRKLREYDA